MHSTTHRALNIDTKLCRVVVHCPIVVVAALLYLMVLSSAPIIVDLNGIPKLETNLS